MLERIFSNNKTELILIIIGLSVYFVSLFGQFVWDDDFLIVNNPYIHSVMSSFNYFSPYYYRDLALDSPEGFYRPLTMVYFSLVYQFSSAPFLFHFLQIIIHVFNSIMVYRLFKHFFTNPISTILSLIFLVHPINTEAVAYISATQDVLTFTFGISALLIIITKPLKLKSILLGSLLLLASMLTRESGIIFISFILFYGFFYRRKDLLKICYSPIISVALYLLLRVVIDRVYYFGHTISPIMQLPLHMRLLNIPKILWFYFSTFLFPMTLSTSRMWTVKTAGWLDFFLPLILILVLCLLSGVSGFFLYKHHRKSFTHFLLFYAWLLSGLLLFMQIIPLDFTVTERWFYAPMIGLLGILGLALSQLSIPKKLNILYVGILIFILAALSLRTIVRTFNWQSPYSLYSHDVLISRESFDLHTNMGVELAQRRQYTEAEKHLETSVRLAPYNYVNYNNLGLIYWRQKKYDKAHESFEKSLSEMKKFYGAYINLTRMYFSLNDFKNAEATIKRALSVFPDNPDLWNYLAQIKYKQGDLAEAVKDAKRAYEIEPNSQNTTLYFELSGLPK